MASFGDTVLDIATAVGIALAVTASIGIPILMATYPSRYEED